MNIFDFDSRIYGTKKLQQGEYANSMMESIERQELLDINFNNDNDNVNFYKTNKEIKF